STRVSGSRWTRCATRTTWSSCGRAARRPGRAGPERRIAAVAPAMSAVTVGLPVYNGAESLDRALGSLCAQTFADLSILVSDNASTDETPRIIASWAARDARVRVHRHPRNVGAKDNFRWVLDGADTAWVATAAHDDAWSPNYVEALHRVITAPPGFVIAVPQVV